MRMAFSIRLYSDYHTGAGHGLGTEIDSALLRDADGVPCLRGTLIEGILRNQLEILLSLKPLASIKSCAGGGCAPGSEPCPLCRIFGSPHFPKRWRFGSARPQNVTEPVTSGWMPGRTASGVIWQNRVNPRTGRAEDNKLFSRERGSAELRFAFEVECLQRYPHSVMDASLLVAAARMARSLGSGKNRGLGDCRINLVDVSQDLTGHLLEPGVDCETQLLQYFQKHIIEGMDPPGTTAIYPAWESPDAGKAGGPVRIQVIARADEPLVLADRMEVGNQYGGANYISGRALLGALATRAAGRWDLGDVNNPVYKDFISVFRRDNVRFSMLYPAYLGEGRLLFPCLPAPLDLLSCKVFHGFDERNKNKHGVTAHAHSDRVPFHCPRCKDKGRDTPLEQIEGFVLLRPDREIYVPKMRQEMHVSIDRDRGRAASGELFGYTALDSGQYFLGEIWCRSESDWSALCRLAGISEDKILFLYIGKALRRGYGKMKVQFKKPASKALSLFVARDISSRVAGVEQPLVLTFLSDAILVDKWGRFYQSLTGKWLAEQLDLGLHEGDIEVKQVFCKTGTAMGFNNHLGLPRWQDAVIKAGSTVGFSIKKQIDREILTSRLGEIEEQGLGLRRNEGFGMVAFNHPIRTGGMRIRPLRLDEEMSLKEGINAARPFDPTGVTSNDKYRLPADLFRDAPWLAVARWLKARSNENLSELISELENEKFSGLHENLFEIRDYTPAKENFFTTKGRKGKDALINKLNEIKDEVAEGQLPQKLQGAVIESLAGSIIDACRSAEGDDTGGI